ncbi:TPA: hypothetical protein N0F65_008655 [Lagenidium giganteum]|uniref:Uncharacterized protein n=1 Tax=Lagenidium giganteum TaxID=4803 RepID=A0AAV2Z4Z3_9STRA|nr:TPA: hypothetical protein N0F65_008655 [Lagenidium giganteum]
MANLISFKSNNIVANGFNNVLRYEFPGSSINFTNTEVAVHSIQMINSQFNIDSTAFGNNTFSIIVPTAATTSTITVTLNDGYYSYADVNRIIQAELVSAGAYLVDASGNNVYYVQITENSVYYAAQIDLASVPTALPSGYTRPSTGLYSSGGSGLPATAYTPQLVINNAEFGKIIGFSAGTYPNAPTTTAQSLLSDITPEAIPGTTISELIDYKPNEYLWMPVSDGTYASVQLIIVDQDERFCRLNDTNILISLAIRKRS